MGEAPGEGRLVEGEGVDGETGPDGAVGERPRGSGQEGSVFFFSSRRRHTRCLSDWSSDVCSSDLKPTAEASTQILIVDHNGFLRHSSERRDRRLRDGGLLRADPDFADVLPIVHRAIHRLHGCVSQKRQLIDRVKTPSRAGERLLEVALVSRHDPRAFGCLLELLDELLTIYRGVMTVVPLYRGGFQTLLSSAHMVGNH